MKKIVKYMGNSASGVTGYTQMNSSWKNLTNNIKALISIKISDKYILNSVTRLVQVIKNMTLFLSRKLGLIVKYSLKKKNNIKNDIKNICNHNYITGSFSVKNSVSDIKVKVDFKNQVVIIAIKIKPSLNRRTLGKIYWINKQLINCEKKESKLFSALK